MLARAENDVDEFDMNIPNSRVSGRFDHETQNYFLENCDRNSDGLVLINLHNRSNGQNQVKWSRSNITATMERFEPAHSNPSMSPTPSLDYGFAATVVNSKTESRTSLKNHHSAEMPSNVFRRDEATRSKNHNYSYAYYDAGAVKCHRNVPRNGRHTSNKTKMAYKPMEISNNTQHNYVRTLLSKGHHSKSSSANNSSSSLSAEDRHTFTTRYGTTENLYEEVSEQNIRKVLSDNPLATTANSVKEELRLVQHNHFRVLDELNLSLEALIMPSSSQNSIHNSENNVEDSSECVAGSLATGKTLTSGVTASTKILPPKPRRYGLLGGESNGFLATSIENMPNSIQSVNPKDLLRNPNNNTDLDEGDLDSGFSGSGSSSGTSYNECLRYFKPITGNQITLHTKYACCSPLSTVMFTSKNSLTSQDISETNITENISNKCCEEVSPKAGNKECTAHRCNRHPLDMQNLSTRSTPSEISTVTKSKKPFWTMEP